MHTPSKSLTSSEGHPQRWWILVTVSLIIFILSADNTILNVAIPTLTRELNATASETKWFIEGYILVFCGLMLTGGALADRFGARTMIVTGLTIFGATTLVAGSAPSSFILIAGRAGMGFGAAMMFPATLSVLKQVFSDAERPKAIAVWTAIAVLGALVGPIMGGVILGSFAWGVLFFYKLPIVVIAGVMAWRLIPKLPTRVVPLDLLGSLLSVLAVSSLVFTIIEGPKWGLTSTLFWMSAVASVALLVGFVIWEQRTKHPMLDVTLFKNPAFSAASVSVVLAYFAMSGLSFNLTQFLQYVSGYSPLQAALRTLPMAAAALVGSAVAAPIITQIGTRWTIVGGLLLTSASFFLYATLSPSSGDVVIIVAGVLLGAGAGAAGTASFTSVLDSVPADKAGSASAVNETGIEFGNALGLAVLGTILSNSFTQTLLALPVAENLQPKEADNILSVLGAAERLGGETGTTLAQTARVAFSSAMDLTAFIGAGVVLFGAFVAWRFLKATRAQKVDGAKSGYSARES
jgi:MFS transporter, DHA2 family, multidrug resistance protein